MSTKSKIRRIIKQNGYITIDELMMQALSDNKDSYYRSAEHIGAKGDFITAPEISQLFGEIIALWAIEKWQELGSPAELCLAEFGPGQGQLMQDFLRVARLVPDFFNACKLYLLEINPYFIAKQKSKLLEYKPDTKWIKDLSQLPKKPSLIIANEFFDALPIKQYIKKDGNWFESVMVFNQKSQRNQYGMIEIDHELQNKILSKHINAEDGAVFEESEQSLEITKALSTHLDLNGGASLIIDYGYNFDAQMRTRNQYNSTLQALKDHKYQEVTELLGDADLTAHVDFNALKQISLSSLSNLKTCQLSTQREFLLKYGIGLRVRILKIKAPEHEQDILDRQVSRLIDPQHMGELFKVLEICS
ncbi:MAG: SAM-dependent methyltransferase [Rickettsiaceae bacterium]|nr:SAM-dependent methyltransferase [Rickettsiaceae bacterium]